MQSIKRMLFFDTARAALNGMATLACCTRIINFQFAASFHSNSTSSICLSRNLVKLIWSNLSNFFQQAKAHSPFPRREKWMISCACIIGSCLGCDSMYLVADAVCMAVECMPCTSVCEKYRPIASAYRPTKARASKRNYCSNYCKCMATTYVHGNFCELSNQLDDTVKVNERDLCGLQCASARQSCDAYHTFSSQWKMHGRPSCTYILRIQNTTHGTGYVCGIIIIKLMINYSEILNWRNTHFVSRRQHSPQKRNCHRQAIEMKDLFRWLHRCRPNINKTVTNFSFNWMENCAQTIERVISQLAAGTKKTNKCLLLPSQSSHFTLNAVNFNRIHISRHGPEQHRLRHKQIFNSRIASSTSGEQFVEVSKIMNCFHIVN